jgi:hypothetical protein
MSDDLNIRERLIELGAVDELPIYGARQLVHQRIMPEVAFLDQELAHDISTELTKLILHHEPTHVVTSSEFAELWTDHLLGNGYLDLPVVKTIVHPELKTRQIKKSSLFGVIGRAVLFVSISETNKRFDEVSKLPELVGRVAGGVVIWHRGMPEERRPLPFPVNAVVYDPIENRYHGVAT